jgi:predicted TPR repeat methyltransferase
MTIEEHESDVFDDDPVEQADALIKTGRAAEAATLLARRVKTGRGGLLARFTLVRAYMACGETSNALVLARELSHANAHIAEAALVLGEALASAAMLPAAIAEFQRALRIAPELIAAHLALAEAWLDAGEPDKADEALLPLNQDPRAAELRQRALHMRAQLRSDAGYVRHLFDQFSGDYDSRMREQLCYAAPEVLRTLAELVLPRKTDLWILDVGCGTGLAGAVFKDMASRMDGIDLSPAMIAKARAKGIYANLECGDIEKPEGAGTYDLAIAADTLVYLGDFDPTFAAIASRLRPGGFFLFTVEKQLGEGFVLGPKRRWRHAESYLRGCASRHGFQIAGLLECVPRTEAGAPVEGLACALETVGRKSGHIVISASGELA